MSDKAIDLGKLQDAQRKAVNNFNAAQSNVMSAVAATAKARTAEERARTKWSIAKKELDQANQAVLEGARTVASNS
jgi:hypothetical protein